MTVYKNRSGTWASRFAVNGRRYQRSFVLEEEARGWEDHMRSLLDTPDDRSAIELASAKGNNIASLLKVCLERDWLEHSKGHRDHCIHCAKTLGWDRHPSEVTMLFLDDLVVKLKAKGLSNGRIRNFMNCYRVMLKRAMRLGWIDRLPAFPEGRTIKPSEPRDLVLDPSWVSALLEQLDSPHNRLLVRFLYLTGARVSEALNLEWSRCSFERRRIQFIKTKTLNPRALPMSDELRDILIKCQRLNQRGPFYQSYADIYRDYMAAKEHVCFALKLGDTVQKEWVIHTLRHTCLTQLAMRGATAIQIMEWAGHKSLSTSQKYVHQSSINLESLAGFSSCLNDDSAQPLRHFNEPESTGITGISPVEHRSQRTL